MKRLFIIVVLTAFACTSYAQKQKLAKANLLSIKIMEIQLVEGKSLEEFKTFYLSDVIPAYEKAFEGLQIYMLKSVRGEYKNELAVIWIFESEAARNKYFNEDASAGNFTALGKETMERLKGIRQEMNSNYGRWSGNEQDDWIVQ
jgi:hypothetical protein